MAAPTAAAARGGAAAVAPLTSCVPQVDAPCLTCSGQAVLRRRAQAHHGLHFTTTTSRACLSSTKSTSRRPPRRPPGGFRPDREFRGRRQPNRETLHNMPIIRQEGKPSHLNQPGRHAHGCISGRQKQQRGYMLYAQDVTARRRLKPRVCRPRSRSCATPAQTRPPRSAHGPRSAMQSSRYVAHIISARPSVLYIHTKAASYYQCLAPSATLATSLCVQKTVYP